MLHEPSVLIVGEGARRYARDTGAALCDPRDLKADEIVADEACDTVGCVACDARGNLAAGTSTGGLSGVRPGRVGDSPIPGAGLYAENGVGGTSFSGEGESILRLALAARLTHGLATTDAANAARDAQMPRVGGDQLHLANLVAAEGKRQAVVPLDQQPWPAAESLPQILEFFDGRADRGKRDRRQQR